MQLACLLEESNRLAEALNYADQACKRYESVYGDFGDNTIIAQWLKL